MGNMLYSIRICTSFYAASKSCLINKVNNSHIFDLCTFAVMIRITSATTNQCA